MTKKPSRRKTLFLISGAVLIACFVGIWMFVGKDGSERVSYFERPVKRGDILVTITATGTVKPENRLDIKPPIAGRAETVLVKEGQKVKKGQILAWMSSTERAALLDGARAQGPAEVKKWAAFYRPTPILAPISGTIIARNVESGQTFASTDAILTMSDRLTVKAQVDETDMAQVKKGQKADIVLDAYPDQTISATVDKIAFDATTVNNVTTYVIDVLPDETPDFMRSGMTANVKFLINSIKDVLYVPAETISLDKGVSTVLVKTPDGPSLREIESGASDGKRTEILKGLKEGEIVLRARPKGASSEGGSNPFMPFRHHKKRK